MSKKRDISVSNHTWCCIITIFVAKYWFQREEIAKQFLLPERQSKIDTLLKQDGQAYCICRSSDSSRFMIACDACEEWWVFKTQILHDVGFDGTLLIRALLLLRYHGDCIGISEKGAKLIRQYFCVRCSEEDPTLQTRWKTKREEGSSATVVSREEQQKPRKRKDRNDKSDKKNKKCGDCMGCYRTEDCGRCDVCVRKKSSSSRQKERCKQRICVNYGGWVVFF